MSTKTEIVSSGIGFFGLLTIALIVLKALDKIEMSWFWVLTLPIWGPLSIVALAILGFFFVVFLIFLFDKRMSS